MSKSERVDNNEAKILHDAGVGYSTVGSASTTRIDTYAPLWASIVLRATAPAGIGAGRFGTNKQSRAWYEFKRSQRVGTLRKFVFDHDLQETIEGAYRLGGMEMAHELCVGLMKEPAKKRAPTGAAPESA